MHIPFSEIDFTKGPLLYEPEQDNQSKGSNFNLQQNKDAVARKDRFIKRYQSHIKSMDNLTILLNALAWALMSPNRHDFNRAQKLAGELYDRLEELRALPLYIMLELEEIQNNVKRLENPLMTRSQILNRIEFLAREAWQDNKQLSAAFWWKFSKAFPKGSAYLAYKAPKDRSSRRRLPPEMSREIYNFMAPTPIKIEIFPWKEQ
jgi:hypothetical protein